MRIAVVCLDETEVGGGLLIKFIKNADYAKNEFFGKSKKI